MLYDLQIENLRIVTEGSLVPGPGINLIIGGNGSGKTTLLEAIYLLSRGRSFRHREAGPLVSAGEDHFQLVGKFSDRNGGRHVLGLRRAGEQVEVRLDGRNAKRRSEVMGLFPVQWIGPDPQQLITGNPEGRRSFLDAGLFHVEHRYLDLLQRYNKALEQRNAALRKAASSAAIWDDPLVGLATQLDEFRQSFSQVLSSKVEQLLAKWGLDLALDFHYSRGWKAGVSLAEVLTVNAPLDRKRGFTSAGPHRADLIVRSDQLRTGKRLSRGQLKMLASAFYLAQSSCIAEQDGDPGILLYDDLPAELDRQNRELLLAELATLYRQVFVAALSDQDVPLGTRPATMFHVEQGAVQAVLGD